jgi:RNA polymerase sigma-70 factor (ECF subfamily)
MTLEPPANKPPSAGLLDIASLVTNHHGELYRYAYRLSGQVADAEDLTQQTFLVAQSKLDQVRSAEACRGWLFAILRNCFLKSVRGTPLAPASKFDLQLDSIPDDVPDESAVDPERLQRALDELPAEFRVVLTMFYFEELSYREIAEQLELPPGTVMSRLSRAKGHLRARLLDQELAAATNGRRTPTPEKNWH